MVSIGAPLSEWLAWLETLSPTEINLGLERVQQMLVRLQVKRPDHVLLIAGTNGKGSSVAMSDALLRAAGKRVGAYTSPHVNRYNERIVIDGVSVDDAKIIAAFEKIESVREDLELTYFEYGTLAAVVVFAQADLDVWILEVGLGGRLDATNAIDPTASLITNVTLDHCDWLGNDVETIAVEKAGVMRAGIPTVFGSLEIPQSILRHATAIGAKLQRAGKDFHSDANADGSWRYRGASCALDSLLAPGLLGAFQISNAAAVLALLDAASLLQGIDAALINAVLPTLTLVGRSERLFVDNQEWLIDVAHNPAAAEMLATTLERLERRANTTAIVGLLNDKDTVGVIEPLSRHIQRWIAITADSHRAVAANELARRVSNITGRACLVADSAAAAIELARRGASENDRIVVTGSFFTVGPVRKLLAAESRPKS